MGLFTREPAEKKAFWKAFNKAYKKPGAQTFPELEAACQAWPEGWQGYLLMGLCYDLAAGVEFNPDKAKEYHYKAKTAGDKAGAGWVSLFYEIYDGSPVNFRIKEDYYPRTGNVRKLGAAILFSYREDEQNILNGILADDLHFWDKLLSKIDTGGLFGGSEEQSQVFSHRQPFVEYVSAYLSCNKGKDEQIMAQNGKALIKKVNKVAKIKKEKMNTDTIDTWSFIAGYSLLFGGTPYYFMGDSWHENTRIDGWEFLWGSAQIGCSAAARTLAMFWDDETFHNEIIYAGKHYFTGGATERELIGQMCLYMMMAAEKGDKECAYYYDIFSAKDGE